MWENTNQNNSDYRHFLRSESERKTFNSCIVHVKTETRNTQKFEIQMTVDIVSYSNFI